MAGSSPLVPRLALNQFIDEELIIPNDAPEEDVKQEELSRFIYTAQVAERVESLFLCAWNAWARFALIAAARRDAAIEVRFYVNRSVEMFLTKEENKSVYRLLKTVLEGWLGITLWAVKLRKLGRTAGTLLKRCQFYEDATAKQLLFALWLSRLQASDEGLHIEHSTWTDQRTHATNTLATPARPITKILEPSIEETSDHPRSLDSRFNALELLVSVRSRRWRLVCDIRSLVDGSLLRVSELHAATDALLSLAARRVVHARLVSEEHEQLEAQGLADVLPLSVEAETCYQQLQQRLCDRQVLLDTLLDSISGAVNLVAERQKNAGVDHVDDDRWMKLVSIEIHEIAADEREIRHACLAALDRIEIASRELRPFKDALQELIGNQVKPDNLARCGLEPDEQAFDGAGGCARRLLQIAATGVSALRDDTRRLLQYLNDSDSVRKFQAASAMLPPMPPLMEVDLDKRLPQDVHIAASADFLQEAIISGVLPMGAQMELDRFLLRCKLSRLQPVWQAWRLYIQSTRRLKGVAMDSRASPVSYGMYIRPSPHCAPRGAALYGGPTGPATRGTVRSVEQLFCGM